MPVNPWAQCRQPSLSNSGLKLPGIRGASVPMVASRLGMLTVGILRRQCRRRTDTKTQPTENQIDANVTPKNVVSAAAPTRRLRLGCAWSFKRAMSCSGYRPISCERYVVAGKDTPTFGPVREPRRDDASRPRRLEQSKRLGLRGPLAFRLLHWTTAS